MRNGQLIALTAAALVTSAAGTALGQQTIARWDFEDQNLIVDQGAGTLANNTGATVSYPQDSFRAISWI